MLIRSVTHASTSLEEQYPAAVPPLSLMRVPLPVQNGQAQCGPAVSLTHLLAFIAAPSFLTLRFSEYAHISYPAPFSSTGALSEFPSGPTSLSKVNINGSSKVQLPDIHLPLNP